MTTDAVSTESWGTMEWLADANTMTGLGLSLARMTVLPNQTSPAHRHPNCNEVIHILAGSIDQRIGDTWTACQTGDTIIAPFGATHQTRCTSTSKAVLMIAYSDDKRTYEEVSQ